MITVYSKPACPQCLAVKHWLDKAKLDYDTVDVSTNPAALAYIASLGYASIPVVVAGEEHWWGVRPDRISALVAR
jgi:glutaredoxin-like protein NrdH